MTDQPTTENTNITHGNKFTMSLQSAEIKDVVSALANAQGEIENAQKDSENPHFKSKYADLASVWKACRTQLSKNGLTIAQQPIFIDNYGLVMVTTLYHTSGQWLRSFLPVDPAKKDPQGLGSAITYMRRYALAAMVGVAPDDDDDGNAASMNKNTLEDQQKHIMQAIKKADFILKTLDASNIDVLRDDARTIFKYLPEEKRMLVTDAIQNIEKKSQKTTQEATASGNPDKASAKKAQESPAPSEMPPEWIDEALHDLNQAKDMAEIDKIAAHFTKHKQHIPEKRTESIRKVIEASRKRVKSVTDRQSAQIPNVQDGTEQQDQEETTQAA